MATTIVGNSIISDSYAPFGELPQMPDRPEPPRRERVLLSRDQVIAQVFGGDEETFDLAFQYAFPPPFGRKLRTGAPMWEAGMIAKWREKLQADIKRLSKVALSK